MSNPAPDKGSMNALEAILLLLVVVVVFLFLLLLLMLLLVVVVVVVVVAVMVVYHFGSLLIFCIIQFYLLQSCVLNISYRYLWPFTMLTGVSIYRPGIFNG